MGSDSRDVEQVIEELRAQGVDVVRVSYSDLIGVDRGRDVLIDELRTAVREVFVRSPFMRGTRMR